MPTAGSPGRRPTLTLARTNLRSLTLRGVAVRVRCAAPAMRCTATVRLRAAGRTLATRRGTTVRLKPSRLLLRARTFEVVADVRQGTRTIRVTKRLTLQR
jgi:hypothetical protein